MNQPTNHDQLMRYTFAILLDRIECEDGATKYDWRTRGEYLDNIAGQMDAPMRDFLADRLGPERMAKTYAAVAAWYRGRVR
jgi:hypothetical protein